MEELREIFLSNFAERQELGASLSVWQQGREVVSLHHGWKNREQNGTWTEDTLVPVWSVTKGPAALTALLALHEAGVALHDPVSKVWPELKAAGGGLSFAGLLSHQAGLPGLSPDNQANLLQHDAVSRAMEKQEPFWVPGRGHGYHPRTIGYLWDEVVRRLTGGTTLGAYWRERIALPGRIDFYIGNVPAEALSRLAVIYPPRAIRPPEEELPFYRAIARPDSVAYAAFASPEGMKSMGEINQLAYLQAGLPSLGGVGSARALARFYQLLACDGVLEGRALVPQAVVRQAREKQGQGMDHTLLLPTGFTAGFMQDPLNESGGKIRSLFGPSLEALGQPGAGGSHAFADPATGISFAYVMNQMEAGILPNEKSLAMVREVFRLLA